MTFTHHSRQTVVYAAILTADDGLSQAAPFPVSGWPTRVWFVEFAPFCRLETANAGVTYGRHDVHPGVTADPGNDRPSHCDYGTDSVVVVDNRNEVRDFLISRRARITPDQAGLPAYGGNRRVPGLRREEVALLAGVSIDYYTRLERGKLNGVSEGVLEALADALQLDEAERAHLFDLARAGNHLAHPASHRAAAHPAQCAADLGCDHRRAGVRTQRPPRHLGREPTRLRALLRDVSRPGAADQRCPIRLPQPAGPYVLPRLERRSQRHCCDSAHRSRSQPPRPGPDRPGRGSRCGARSSGLAGPRTTYASTAPGAKTSITRSSATFI